MKKISIQKMRKQLVNWNADLPTIELIINNVQLYNDQIDTYKEDGKGVYVLYQLNVQITKQLEAVKKFVGKNIDDSDPFEMLVSELKNKTEIRYE
jgi:hypothetical protein